MSGGDEFVLAGCSPVVETEYGEGSERTPTEAVIDAVAAAEGVDVGGLPPLYEAVDPDALDRLFERADGDDPVVLAFAAADWTVFVRGDGTVVVCDGGRTAGPSDAFGLDES